MVTARDPPTERVKGIEPMREVLNTLLRRDLPTVDAATAPYS